MILASFSRPEACVSNSVTRQVNFKRTKIDGKCQNSRIFGWFSNNVSRERSKLLQEILAIFGAKIQTKVRGFFLELNVKWDIFGDFHTLCKYLDVVAKGKDLRYRQVKLKHRYIHHTQLAQTLPIAPLLIMAFRTLEADDDDATSSVPLFFFSNLLV